MWDRHDIATLGPDCTTEQFRTSKLVTLAMAAVRACSKSRVGFEAGCEKFEALRRLAETIPADIGPSAQGNRTTDNSTENEDPMFASQPHVHRDIEVSMSASQPSKMKGSKRTRKDIDWHGAGTSNQKEKMGTRQCKSCGLYAGHYSTTCPLNPVVASRGKGRRGTMGTQRGRPPINRQLEHEFLKVATDEADEEWDGTEDD